MARSTAATVDEYLAELPPAPAEPVRRVRELVNENIPPGYQEVMNWGQWSLGRYRQLRLRYVQQATHLMTARANQKNYVSLYLMPAYAVPEYRAMLDNCGKKLKMGKICISFVRLAELPPPEIAEIIRRTTVERYLATVADRPAGRCDGDASGRPSPDWARFQFGPARRGSVPLRDRVRCPMPQRTVVVGGAVGLHARPAALFVQAATAAAVPVTVAKPGKSPVDARSILSVLSLDARGGDEIVLAAEGPGAEEVLAALAALVSQDLDAGAGA